MNLIDSFRDTDGAIQLINQTGENYREAYKAMGLIQ